MSSTIKLFLRRIPSAAWVILILMIVFTSISDKYLTLDNIVNIVQQNAVLLIIGLAATLVLLSQGIDLSLGSVLTFSGVITALTMNGLIAGGASNIVAMIGGVIAGLLTGALMGTITGGLVAIGNLPPFIASLGMMGVGGALALVLTKSSAIYVDNPAFVFFGQKLDKYVNLPLAQYISMPVIIAVLVFLGVRVLLHHTSFGRYIISIGGNEIGARLSGVNTTYWKWAVYITAGIITAIGGIILAARLQAADSIVGVGWEFDAIAAAILGGTSFAKGKGGVEGTILGVLVIGVTRNGLNVIGVPSLWQPALTGTILILAIVFEIVYSARKEGKL